VPGTLQAIRRESQEESSLTGTLLGFPGQIWLKWSSLHLSPHTCAPPFLSIFSRHTIFIFMCGFPLTAKP
jgi:hypothetical protein